MPDEPKTIAPETFDPILSLAHRGIDPRNVPLSQYPKPPQKETPPLPRWRRWLSPALFVGGGLCFASFAFLVWPPLTLLVVGGTLWLYERTT